MTAIAHAPNPYLTAYKSDGTKLEASPGGYTFANGITYYVPISGVNSALLESIHAIWDNAAILTITVETTNHPDATLFSSTAGQWIQENPTTAYVGGAGGFSVVNLTVAVAGGTAGGCMIHLGNLGSLKARLKVVTGGTGGVVNFMGHAKA